MFQLIEWKIIVSQMVEKIMVIWTSLFSLSYVIDVFVYFTYRTSTDVPFPLL